MKLITHAVTQFRPISKVLVSYCGTVVVEAEMPVNPAEATCKKCRWFVQHIGSTTAWLAAVDIKKVAPVHAAVWAKIAAEAAAREVEEAKERVITAENNLKDCEKLAAHLAVKK